jgi:hypothetical protein
MSAFGGIPRRACIETFIALKFVAIKVFGEKLGVDLKRKQSNKFDRLDLTSSDSIS